MKKNEPRILFFDIEIVRNNSAILAEHWFGMSNFYGRTMKGDLNTVCSFGYKLLGEKKAHCINVWDYKKWQDKGINHDEQLVKDAHKILSNVDAVVTHNGKKFDLPFMNTRFMKWGLPPIARVPHIDTKNVAKQHLFMFSNSLNSLAAYLGVAKKIPTTSTLWDQVAASDAKAMKYMSKYCAQDVEVLEKVFKKLLPYINNLPNRNLFVQSDGHVCPNCASKHVIKYGTKITKTKKLQRYQCQDCGSISYTDAKDRNMRVE